jgi:outer membrane protein assembly factor BamA
MPVMHDSRALLVVGLLCGASYSLAARASPVGDDVENDTHAASAAADTGSEPLPSDEQLEASGAHFGDIRIETRQIFDLDDPKDNHWLFRAADYLHVRTHESTIRAQLLFHTGELYSRRLMDESARNMRQNSSFVREPNIQPVHYHDGLVDVVVIVHDVWTVQPSASFGRSGGKNATSVEVTDDNFLGYGKYIEVGHSENVDRSSSYINWMDPNIAGSHWQDTLQYQNNSDGKVWNVGAVLPFYSLETPYAGGGSTGNSKSVVTRYSLGNPFDAYAFDYRVTDFYFGQAPLITDMWTWRMLYGFRHDDSVFTPEVNQLLLAPLPTDRNLAYPYVRMQWVQNTFVTTRNLDQIAFTEDLHFGLDASLGLGWATPAFDADRKAVIADSEISYNWLIDSRDYLFFSGRVYSRFEYGRMDDAIATGNASWFLTTSERSRLLVHLSGDVGHNLDLDHYLEIGGDTGLRGYPLRYQNGDERAQATVEERLYTNWYLFRLLHVGGAAFFDMGRTWGSTAVPTPQLGLLKDVGVGLRLGNARSAFGNIIHIDLATPLDAKGSISRLQFLVSTQQTY